MRGEAGVAFQSMRKSGWDAWCPICLGILPSWKLQLLRDLRSNSLVHGRVFPWGGPAPLLGDTCGMDAELPFLSFPV